MEYQELDELGRGGMAVVYRAVRNGSSDVIAMKRPLPWETCDDRLRREISVLAGLDHPNVMSVLDHGLDDEGKSWYVMPLARGSLKDLWDSGRLGTDAEAVSSEVLEDVCKGLGAIHDAGFVHRDVTPRNILALDDPDDPRGYRWVVADCGLVRRPLGETTLALTGDATRLGTDGYIAPEVHGDPHGATVASDVYSVGRILAWLLTGKKPVVTMQLLPDGKWRAVVRAFTRDDPDRRPQSMSDAHRVAIEMLSPMPVSEKAAFRAQIAEHGGSLRPDNPLWEVVEDHLDDYNFMIDDLVRIEPQAAQKLALARPDLAAAIAEALARHLVDGDYGQRQWDSLNTHLAFVKAVLEGLDTAGRFDLFDDVAPSYCEAVRTWDRFPHNNSLNRWLAGLRGAAGESMARAIRNSGTTDYFRSVVSERTLASPALAALLEPTR